MNEVLFLLNYTPNSEGYKSWILFQAIYFFESEDAQESVLKSIEKVINEDLNLGKKIYYTLANESYERFYLPCGSAFNLKHGKVDDKFVIDIVWAREASK